MYKYIYDGNTIFKNWSNIINMQHTNKVYVGYNANLLGAITLH